MPEYGANLRSASLQLNLGIIAATIPTLKPLLKKTIGTSSSNQYDQFNEIEHPGVSTIGSSRKRSKLHKSFFNTVHTNTDEGDFEMMNMGYGARDRLAATGRGGENMYNVDVDRAGSKDHILEGDTKKLGSIMCTTEVVVDSTRRDSQSDVPIKE